MGFSHLRLFLRLVLSTRGSARLESLNDQIYESASAEQIPSHKQVLDDNGKPAPRAAVRGPFAYSVQELTSLSFVDDGIPEYCSIHQARAQATEL